MDLALLLSWRDGAAIQRSISSRSCLLRVWDRLRQRSWDRISAQRTWRPCERRRQTGSVHGRGRADLHFRRDGTLRKIPGIPFQPGSGCAALWNLIYPDDGPVPLLQFLQPDPGGFLKRIRGAKGPMCIMIFSFVVCRQIYLFFVTKIAFNEYTVGMGYPVGWIVCAILSFLYYRRTQMGRKGKRRLKNQYKRRKRPLCQDPDENHKGLT